MQQLYTKTFFVFLLIQLSWPPGFTQPVLGYQSRITGLTQPVDIVHAGDNSGRLFIVQQNGLIRVYNSSHVFLSNFLTVTGINLGGEEGLLSLAFYPDYENPDPLIGGFFLVYYTNSSGDLELARYHVSANPHVADPLSKVIVLTIPHPVNSNHNGGKLLFGPDGYLYLGTGDGGSGGDPNNNSQNGTSLLGKMLRIAVNKAAIGPFYSIPPSNPFVTNPLIADEIWALGLRNPWRWSFDWSNGDMWIADVGQGVREEVDYIPSGLAGGMNFGWRCFEGTLPYNTSGCQPYSNYYAPIFDYPHNSMTGGFSITGGVVYRGTEFPVLDGYYICADFVSGNQWLIRQTSPGLFNFYRQAAAGIPGNISGFGEAEDRTVYAVSLGAGTVYKLIVTAVLPVRLVSFTGRKENSGTRVSWATLNEDNLSYFVLEYSIDRINFQALGNIAVSGNSTGANYSFNHTNPGSRTYYRLKMVSKDGKIDYSSIIVIDNQQTKDFLVTPNMIDNGILDLTIYKAFQYLRLINSGGQIVLHRNLGGQTGFVSIQINQLPPGIYQVQLISGKELKNEKILIRQ